MDLIVRNKWFSFKGSSVVKDMDENDVLQIEGRFWSFTSKKFIKTLDGEVKYMVRNKFWRLFTYKAFIYDANDNRVATVRRKIFSFHDRYKVTFEDPSRGEVEIKGNIFQYNYDIAINGKVIGHISRKISLRDSFVLHVEDGEDYLFCLALLIAIDNITDRKDANNSSN